MKTTIVPAQITTVEDKVAGNLSVQQLLLFTTPIFISALIYFLLPPFARISGYKELLSIVVFLVFTLAALRVKEELLIHKLLMFSSYVFRPRFHVFSKSDDYLRDIRHQTSNDSLPVLAALPEQTPRSVDSLSGLDRIHAMTIVSDPRTKLRFMAKKGRLNVYFTEIK